MAQQLGSLGPGTLVKLNESGIPVEFYVAAQNYESGLNGPGRTLLVRKDSCETMQWNSVDINTYAGCSLDTWFNTTYKARLDQGIQALLGATKFYYTPGNGNYSVTTLERAVFALSATELGFNEDDNINVNQEGTALPIANMLQNVIQWTRSPDNRVGFIQFVAWSRDDKAGASFASASDINSRPVFTLPSNLTVNDDGTILAYFVPTITVPNVVMQGQSVPLSWAAADSATTYILERSINSGGWAQIYSGPNLSFTDTAGSWTTVQYRVKAGAGSNFGSYTTSPSIPVVSTATLVISGTDSDLGTVTADIPYTVVTDTSNPITLQRTVNGQLVATTTVNNGFGYSIPVLDLPTGSGTIEITASVNTSGGSPVTVTRTWTYTKTSVTFPTSGGPAQLTQGGQNVFPPTLAEAVRVPANWGGSLDKALELLLPLVNSAVIQVGAYEGTGTFGVDNPNTLTFNQEPVVVTIYGGGQTLVISNTDTDSPAYINGKTARWYSTESAAAQMNTDGTTYSYVAVGKQV